LLTTLSPSGLSSLVPKTASFIMVRPRAFAKYLFKKYKGTVIDDIWPELFFFTGVAVSELHF